MNSITEVEISKILYHLSLFNNKILLKNKIKLYKIHLICELLYATGLNISEIACIRIGDVDLNNKVILLPSKKVLFNLYIKDVLLLYLEAFNKDNNSNNLLFSFDKCIDKVVNNKLLRLCKKFKINTITCDDISSVLQKQFLISRCSSNDINTLFFNNGSFDKPISYLSVVYENFNHRKYK